MAVVLAMNFATPEKKLERKIEHRYTVDDPQFERELGVMLGPSISTGNRVDDLQNGDAIFPAMLEAIRGARRNINFETYIYWRGDIAVKFADALSAKAREGLSVKVLLDWVGSLPEGVLQIGTVFAGVTGGAALLAGAGLARGFQDGGDFMIVQAGYDRCYQYSNRDSRGGKLADRVEAVRGRSGPWLQPAGQRRIERGDGNVNARRLEARQL